MKTLYLDCFSGISGKKAFEIFGMGKFEFSADGIFHDISSFGQ